MLNVQDTQLSETSSLDRKKSKKKKSKNHSSTDNDMSSQDVYLFDLNGRNLQKLSDNKCSTLQKVDQPKSKQMDVDAQGTKDPVESARTLKNVKYSTVDDSSLTGLCSAEEVLVKKKKKKHRKLSYEMNESFELTSIHNKSNDTSLHAAEIETRLSKEGNFNQDSTEPFMDEPPTCISNGKKKKKRKEKNTDTEESLSINIGLEDLQDSSLKNSHKRASTENTLPEEDLNVHSKKKKKKQTNSQEESSNVKEDSMSENSMSESSRKIREFSSYGFSISQSTSKQSAPMVSSPQRIVVESQVSNQSNQHTRKMQQFSDSGFCILQTTSGQSDQRKKHKKKNEVYLISSGESSPDLTPANRETSADVSETNGNRRRRLDFSVSSDSELDSHNAPKRSRIDEECIVSSEEPSTSQGRASRQTLQQIRGKRSGESQENVAEETDTAEVVEFHTINTVSQEYWSKVYNELVEKGIDFNVGKWLPEEIARLKKNWEEIVKDCPFEHPYQLFMFGKNKYLSSEAAYSLVKYVQETQFYIRLGKGIRRSLYNIYQKARTQFMPGYHLGKFSEEDTETINRIVQLRGGDWKYVGDIIERNSRVAREKFRTIKPGRINGPWSAEEDFLLDELVAEYLGKKDGRVDDEIPFDIPWTEIGAKMPTRDYKQCRVHWVTKRKVVEGQPPPIKVSKRALIEAVAAQNPVTQGAINWLDVRDNLDRTYRPQYYSTRFQRTIHHMQQETGVKPFNETLELLVRKYGQKN